MADLIALVRDMIGDPAGESATFTDNQIERSLDIHRWDIRYQALKPLPTVVSGGAEYREWHSEEQYWEADAVLYDGSYHALTPSESDALHGRWVFASHQSSVLALGKVYDPYGAAADLLEMWAGKTATEYDVEADGARMNRSQKRQALKELASVYRRQQRILTGRQIRDDLR